MRSSIYHRSSLTFLRRLAKTALRGLAATLSFIRQRVHANDTISPLPDSVKSEMSNDGGVPITIEFTYVRSCTLRNSSKLMIYSGGLEILFGNQKKYSLSIPEKDESGAPANVAFLVRYICENFMKDTRKELFVLDDTV